MTESIQGAKVLVVDDHKNIRVSLRLALEGEGALVTEADCVKEALAKLGPQENMTTALFPYHLVLLDIRMPDGSGIDVLKRLSEHSLASRVIMISGEGTVTDAFKATQMGAFDYIEKPFGEERIIVSARRALSFNQIRLDNVRLTKQVLRGQEIVGNHPKLKEVLGLVERVAKTNGRVLITGESGTGKELIARAVHRQSQRASQPLVKVNCAAIPASLIESELFGHEKGSFTGAIKARRGVFEQADGGTLFLDEIGELQLDVQAKLLRVLQSGELQRVGSEKVTQVDVRLIAATNRDLAEMVQAGEFREDLFYRLNVVTVHLPPLRERSSDIAQLAENFLAIACEEHSLGHRSFSKTALEQLSAYHWPGNIRELKNIVERIAILAEIETIDELSSKSRPATAVADLPAQDGETFAWSSGMIPWQEFHEEAGKAYLKYVLKKAKGNVSETSRLLCLERAYLHRLMKKLGVQRDIVVLD
jgi:DNA-binding NtrC family response regulator